MADKSEDYLGIKEYKVVGKRPIRHDGTDKVTGRAVYGADVKMSRLLYGKTLRSPNAHARIKSIDTSKAENHPGVRAVVTSSDLVQEYEDKVSSLGEASVGLRHLIGNVLARDKVLYDGHAIAAVAATSVNVAQEAIELIQVEYEVLEPVLDVRKAMEKGAPLLHEDMKMRSLGEQTDEVSNIANHFQHKVGDPEKAFEECDVVIEREFTTQTVHQGYIEPHNATANWNPDGKVTVWVSTQGPFDIRNQVSDVLGMSVSDIRVIPTEIGGGFGGKFRVYEEPTAVLLSKKTGHPVKMVMTRTEVLKATGPTPGSYLKVKMGAKKDGTLVAAQAYMAYEAGAMPGSPVGASYLKLDSPCEMTLARALHFFSGIRDSRKPTK